MKKNLFAKITKVDEEQRLVYGTLVEEKVDKDDEIFDYDGSKPFFEKWNATFEKNTDGKSVGNLREMHGKVAAGMFTEMIYDDAAKQIDVVAKVVDDDAWKKCAEGVYTGFSIGARRVKSWTDKAADALRWIANPYEGSLVDNPCMYGCTFSAVKADGVKEDRKFAAKNTNAEKGLYTISDLASVCSSLNYVAQSMEYEAQYEGDGSALPGKIRDICKQLCALLVEYTQEETSEAMNDLDAQASAKNTIKGASMTTKKTAEPGERPAAAASTPEAGVRTEKTQTATPTPQTPPSATSAPAEKKAPNKAELLTALDGIRAQIDALDKGEEAPDASTTVSAETPASTTAPEKADGVQTVSDDKVAKLIEDAQKLVDENKTLKTTLAKTNELLETISKRAMPTTAKLIGSLVDKEGDNATGEKSDEDHAKEVVKKAKESGDVRDVLKLIHRAGPSQRIQP